MPHAKHLLFIAAQAREFSGLLPHVRVVRPLDLPAHWAREGQLNGEPIMMIANGVGPYRAAAGLQLASKPRAVISTGFCGALDHTYRIADVFVATTVEW